ncbi:MAG: 16S rRNA (guanine(966)-N(2))-methyltransferase RsmD [Actinomycetota bacterium]
MRVTGGEAKGTRLRTLPGAETRPTTDMARKAIFDILGPSVEGARVLDLFAGSGAVGIEALSRGALEAVFVESSREACGIILANLTTAGIRAKGVLRRRDAEKFIAREATEPFDLAFLDPPYSRGLRFVARILGKLGSKRWIRTGGTVVVEAASGSVEWPEGFRETRVKRFGRTQVTMAVYDDA